VINTKLSIAQVVLAFFIVLASCYVTGWMIWEATDLLEQPAPDFPVAVTNIELIQPHETLFNISRYGSVILPILGLLVLTTSLVLSIRKAAPVRKLLTINIVATVLILILAIGIITYGDPQLSYTAREVEHGSMITMFVLPDDFPIIVFSTAAIFPLCLSALGCGIAQLVKSRKVVPSK
jgi:hypothetical protein